MEPIGRRSRDPIRLACVLADDIAHARPEAVDGACPDDLEAHDEHRRRPRIPRHPRVLVTERRVPIGPRVEGYRIAQTSQGAARSWRPRSGTCADRRTVEEGLDDLADTLVVMLGRHDEARPLPRPGRAAAWGRRLVGQL